jgi:hypothetical protein
MSQHDRPPQRTGVRLILEALEAREVPAAYYWSPTNGLGTGQPENWLMGQGLPALRHTYPPNGDDHLYFGPGWSGGNSDAYIRPPEGAVPLEFPPPVTELNFAGVHLLVGYTHRVTNQTGDLLVGTFNMHGGTLRQADSELMDRTDPPEVWPIDWVEGPGVTALTVRDWFSWTGGTINDGDLAGELNLAPTASGLAEPVDGGTVQIGSTFTLQGDLPSQTGSTLEMKGGNFDVLRGDGFVAEGGSSLYLTCLVVPPLILVPPAPVAKLSINGKESADPSKDLVRVKAGATAVVRCLRPENNSAQATLTVTHAGGSPRVVNDGTLTITNLTNLKMERNAAVANSTGTYSSGGTTNIQAGSGIYCTGDGGASILGGTLNITPLTNSSGVPLPEQPEAFVYAPDATTQAALHLGTDSVLDMPPGDKLTAGRYNRLRVTGKMNVLGEIKLAMANVLLAQCDNIVVTGDVFLSANSSKLTLRWGSEDGYLDPGTIWRLIESENGTVTSMPAAARITVPPDDTFNHTKVVVEQSLDQKVVRAKKVTY